MTCLEFLLLCEPLLASVGLTVSTVVETGEGGLIIEVIDTTWTTSLDASNASMGGSR